MNRRAFASALLALALAACGDATIAEPASLAGSWAADPVPLEATLPNGSTTAVFFEQVHFLANGGYARTVYARDTGTGRTWTLAFEQGTWAAAANVVRVTVTKRFSADPSQAQETPIPAPIAPEERSYTYAFAGRDLLLTTFCGPAELCTGQPRRLHSFSLLD